MAVVRSRTLWLVIGALVIALLSSGMTYVFTAHDTEVPPVPYVARCGQFQLQTASLQDVGAGGTDAYTIVILNTSRHTCSLKGFAALTFDNQWTSAIHAAVRHRPSMLFTRPAPILVVVAPGASASFAISYSEEFTPRHDGYRSCLATGVKILVPGPSKSTFEYVSPINIDLCFAGHVVLITPFEVGAVPQYQ